nr:transposase (putative), gypsy type [Tanacetum cinerariifolium]
MRRLFRGCWYHKSGKETEEVNSGLKRKRATGGEDMDASPTTLAKDVTETPPPNVEAASNTSAPVTHVGQSPPKTSSFSPDNLSQGGRETGTKVFKGMPADQLIEEIDMVVAHQAALVAQLKASRSVQKDEEIALLKTQLADARVEAESARSYAHKLAEEKMSLLVQLDQKRASSAVHMASCHWVVKYLEVPKNNHFVGLEEFRQGVEKRLEEQEGKLRKLSIEYDKELYPHLVSSIAERRWLISHGLRLTLESQEVKQSFGDVVKYALARGRAEAVEELHENKLLTVPAVQVPGYNKDAYEELVAAMEKIKLLEFPHIAQLERDQDYPIDVIMAGLTFARHDTEGAKAQSDFFLKLDEIPLKDSLEAHSMRLAKKKGVKGKAILCGVGAAHLPRSDGVPVSVATVSPRDSDLLEKLKEARNVVYQVNSSER